MQQSEARDKSNKKGRKLGMVVQTFRPSPREAKACKSL